MNRLTDKEYEVFLMHVDSRYFYCYICNDYHKGIKRKNGEYGVHSYCQAPAEVTDGFYR